MDMVKPDGWSKPRSVCWSFFGSGVLTVGNALRYLHINCGAHDPNALEMMSSLELLSERKPNDVSRNH